MRCWLSVEKATSAFEGATSLMTAALVTVVVAAVLKQEVLHEVVADQSLKEWVDGVHGLLVKWRQIMHALVACAFE